MFPNFISCLLGTAIVLIGIHVTICNAVAISEAEQIALEVSEVMLPPKKLTRTINEHLKAIRKLYPEMAEIHHSPKWVPGELIVRLEDEKAIQNINASRYGPVTADKISADLYTLKFAKPYHPARLVERLTSELGVKQAEANQYVGDGNDISYHDSAPTYYTYTFKMGWGDCPQGCTYQHFWQFTVAPSQETLTVKLEKEYGSNLALKN